MKKNISTKRKPRTILSKKVPSSTSIEYKTESLIALINCCSTNISKQTFYNKEDTQRLTLLNIHSAAFETSRMFYALMLLPDFVTDVNKKIIVANLLEGINVSVGQKHWEDALILQSFSNMQPNRIFDILNYIVDLKLNNARTRNLIYKFLDNNRNTLSLWALKYKKSFKRVIRHAHINPRLHDAINFLMKHKYTSDDILLHNYKLAQKGDVEAIYKLPLTVARGFAAKYEIEEAAFLKKFNECGKITQKEQRQQARELHEKGVSVKVDLKKLDLFDLFVYLGMLNENNALPITVKDDINNAARIAAKNVPYRFDDAAVVLDTSLSMSGAKETKNHPLYRCLAIAAVIKELSDTFTEYRMHNVNSLIPKLSSQSNYSTPLLKALKKHHHYIFILGDGYENAPYEGASNLILTLYKQFIDKDNKAIITHFNPVFAAESKDVRNLFINKKYNAIGIRNDKSLSSALFLSMSKQNPLQALTAYFTVLLRLQNKIAQALQPKEAQLKLE